MLSCRSLSIAAIRSDTVTLRPRAISFSPFQNASSRLTLVLWPEITIERLTTRDFITRPKGAKSGYYQRSKCCDRSGFVPVELRFVATHNSQRAMPNGGCLHAIARPGARRREMPTEQNMRGSTEIASGRAGLMPRGLGDELRVRRFHSSHRCLNVQSAVTFRVSRRQGRSAVYCDGTAARLRPSAIAWHATRRRLSNVARFQPFSAPDFADLAPLALARSPGEQCDAQLRAHKIGRRRSDEIERGQHVATRTVDRRVGTRAEDLDQTVSNHLRGPGRWP